MVIKTDKEEFFDYLKDSSNFIGNAEILFLPENQTEVREAVLHCYKRKIPFTVSGAGTGLCGGRVPVLGAVISTRNLNRILEFDFDNKLVRVEPGVLFTDLEAELNHYGYFLPPNPTEKNSSIGGNVSTNASGAKSFKYGPFRKWVNSLKVILSDGRELLLKKGSNPILNNSFEIESEGKLFRHTFQDISFPSVKNATGYFLRNGGDVIDLFIGSEGTLGVVTEIELKIIEQPESLLGGVIFFDDIKKLLQFVDELRALSRINNKSNYNTMQELSARVIEFFDEKSLNLIRSQYPDIPDEAKASIWFEQEYATVNEEILLGKWNDLINQFTPLADYTWLAMNHNQQEKLREFRHAMPSKIYDMISAKGTRKIGTDTSVPDEHFTGFYEFVEKEIKATNLDYAIWGHFGDAHIHANVIPFNHSEYQKGLEFYDKVINETLHVNGSVSAEHGIGKIKKEYFYRMFGSEAIEEMKKIKNLFDPYDLIGKGNLFKT